MKQLCAINTRASVHDRAIPEMEEAIVSLWGAVGQIGGLTRLVREAGSGFAMVAGEVKDLASQTATAAQGISQHIEGVSRCTEAGVETGRRIARSARIQV